MENVIKMVKYISHPKILISAFFKLRKDDTTLNLPINITGGTRINITGGTLQEVQEYFLYEQ